MRTLENLLRLVPLLKEKMGCICGSSFVTNVCWIFASNVVGWDTLPLLAKPVWRLLVEFLTLEKAMDLDWDLLSRILSHHLNKIRRTTHLHSALKLVGGQLGCRRMMLLIFQQRCLLVLKGAHPKNYLSQSLVVSLSLMSQILLSRQFPPLNRQVIF